MRRLSSIVAVFIVLLTMMPVLACASTPKMTRMEQDCCRHMHGNCGEMANERCCHIEVRNDPSQLPAQVVTASVLPRVAIAFLYPPLVALPASAGHPRQSPNQHSPPGLLIVCTTVLRI